MALQIFGSELGAKGPERDFADGSVLSESLLQIWPYVARVTMPPRFVMSLTQLEEVSAAFTGPFRVV